MNYKIGERILQAAFGPPVDGGHMPEESRVREMADKLAGMNHAKWLENRRITIRKEGGDMSREKTENGETFDIAVEWSELHPIWKRLETEKSEEYIRRLLPMYRDFMEKISSEVHEIWMETNGWAKEKNPDLFVDYDSLPKKEQEKDRVVARNVLGIINETR